MNRWTSMKLPDFIGQTGILLAHERTGEASTVDVPDWFKTCCSALGMSRQAPIAWSSMHVRPQMACLLCLSAAFAAPFGMVPMFIFASQPYRWAYHPFVIMWGLTHATAALSLWRNGPLPGRAGYWQLAYMLNCLLMFGSCNLAAIIMIFGPEESCLFQDRLAMLIVDAASLFLTVMAAFFGAWPPDYPQHPHRYGHHFSTRCRPW